MSPLFFLSVLDFCIFSIVRISHAVFKATDRSCGCYPNMVHNALFPSLLFLCKAQCGNLGEHDVLLEHPPVQSLLSTLIKMTSSLNSLLLQFANVSDFI